MTGARLSIAVGALALFAAGCTNSVSEKVAAVEGMSAQGSPFSAGLHKGYTYQAKLEAKEYDFRDARRWVGKAESSSKGTEVPPEDLANWSIPESAKADLSGARGRLLAALAAGAATKIPGDAARAQVSFDCWVQEQEENIQPDDIRACRGDFEDAMAKVEDALKPQQAAAPAPAPIPGPFVVYFDNDSDKVRADEQQTLRLVLDAASKIEGAKVVVTGHTDRAGKDGYNMVLSKKRVDSVAASLISSGLASTAVEKGIFGEEKPAVATADGKSEARNRRVEITIKK